MCPRWSHIRGRARRFGKTTAMAEAAKKVNGALVCMNAAEAKRVEREFGVPAIAAYQCDRLRGTKGPVFFDPDAVAEIAYRYEAEIDALNERIVKLEEQRAAALAALR